MLHTDPITIQFIQEHLHDDTNKLLLAAKKYQQVDIPFVVGQIRARLQIKDKLPEWYACKDLIIPSRISAEQCSSALTAAYKQRLVKGDSVCDLTGGLGVDTYYLAQKTVKSYYIERFDSYCEAARHNLPLLGVNHVEIIQGDCRDMLLSLPDVGCFYIDPARRGDANKRLFAINECEPDVLAMKTVLLEKATRLIIKVSPMADIVHTLQLLPETSQVHILSVRNECKELLFVLDRERSQQPNIYCINYRSDGTEDSFVFTLQQEHQTDIPISENVKKYLYEPNASILKAGAFRSVAHLFGLLKLHVNSHLYTSNQLLPHFPGRGFEVHSIIDFSSKNIKKLSDSIPKANITVRNFPLKVEQIRTKTHIKEGGENYLFATTLSNDQKVLIDTFKIMQ